MDLPSSSGIGSPSSVAIIGAPIPAEGVRGAYFGASPILAILSKEKEKVTISTVVATAQVVINTVNVKSFMTKRNGNRNTLDTE